MITRFAPSPTGPLHLGHAYSAILAHDMAMAAGGTFVLRIEDIDRARAKPQWEAQIYEDLEWLGLSWQDPVMRQSDRQAAYDAVLDTLWQKDLLFPCTCKRADILAASTAPHGPLFGPDGAVYPGTCRASYARAHSDQMPRPRDAVLRLNTSRSSEVLAPGNDFTGRVASFEETGHGPQGERGGIEFTRAQIEDTIGDIVLARQGMGTSYHLSVVLDDAAQGITHVVRGEDLFEATKIHVFLQRLLNLPTPQYHHHRLIRDQAGKRLAKRDDARAVSKYRSEGASPADIRAMVGL